MENERNEQIIYLKDLLFVALRGWRRLLAAALVLGVVFGGLKFYGDVQKITRSNVAAASQHEIAVQQHAQALKNAGEAILDAEEERKEYEEYLEEALLSNLDSDGFFVAETTYLIRGQNVNIEKILTYYAGGLQTKAVANSIGEAIDEEASQIRDVYRVELNAELGTLRIVCFSNDRKDAQQMLAILVETFHNLKKEVTLFRGIHEIVEVHQGVSEGTDEEILGKQAEAKDKLTDLENAVEKAKVAKASMTEPVVYYKPRTEAVKPAVKYAAAGAVLGIGLIAVYLWLRHMSCRRVYSARTLVNATNVKLLGCAGGEVRNPVDRYLLRLEGRAVADRENRIRLLAVDIRNRLGQNEQLLITGDGDAETRKKFLEILAQQLPNVRFVEKGSLLRDPEAVEALYAQNTVLLLEQCDSSTYEGVNKELEMVADYGKTLIGCVLLNG